MNKNIVLIISGEMASSGGCYNLRIQQIANYINQTNQFQTKVITSPAPIFDGNLLQQCKGILVQRPFVPMPWLKNYKELQPKYGYKMSFEVDDCWWPVIPNYNMAYYNKRDWGLLERVAYENLQYFDCGIVTTQFLADYLHKHYNFWNTVIVPNAADRSIYQSGRKDFFREKPLVLCAGASGHSLEPMPISPQFPTGLPGLRGDFTGAWVEWLHAHIRDFDLHFCTNVPYFMMDCAELISLHQWKYTSMYSADINVTRPDIIFAPLQDNDFNRGKSFLKATEAFACGAVMMGSEIKGGPYDIIHPLCKVPDNPTMEQLDKVYGDIKANWKEILDYQYNFINQNGLWLQSEHHMARWLNAVCTPNQEII